MRHPDSPPAAQRDVKEERESAVAAGLKYLPDTIPGISREKRGATFQYFNSAGRAIRAANVIDRIEGLAIPPAWKDVWICPNPRGHLQATGCDARNRKQYRYHPRWREIRDRDKYESLIRFAKVLPLIRQKVDAHLRKKGLPREKVLAIVVKLLEKTLIRIGNDEYMKTNKSFGLTTMQDRHAVISKGAIHFNFKGKSGVKHDIDFQYPRLAKVVKKCQELPGQRLFQYVDSAGGVRNIDSADVNAYLQSISGDEITAKDFRTWAGSVLAAKALSQCDDFTSESAAKRNITKSIRWVADRLGNTLAVCRKSYIHPAVIDAYLDHTLADTWKRTMKHRGSRQLSAEEHCMLVLLKRRRQK